jgi:hypothetical protein
MSSEAVGRHMPPVVTLDELTAMMAADEHHRYEISPEGVLSIVPPHGYAQDPAQTVTMHRLDREHYSVQATMPLAWVLNTDPAGHGLA